MLSNNVRENVMETLTNVGKNNSKQYTKTYLL